MSGPLRRISQTFAKPASQERKRVGRADLDLVDVITPWKDGLAQEQLAQDAARAPHIDRAVVAPRQDQLRRAVPARDDVLCHRVALLHLPIHAACYPSQPEVADLEVAVAVDEQVAAVASARGKGGRGAMSLNATGAGKFINMYT